LLHGQQLGAQSAPSVHAPPAWTVPYKMVDDAGQVPFSSSVTRSPVGGVVFGCVVDADEHAIKNARAIKTKERVIRKILS
jgi:hypothetical protein